MRKLIREIKKPTKFTRFFKKYVLNKYVITIILFLVWMVFFDNNSFLVIHEIDSNIAKNEVELAHYKSEYEKNNAFFQKLMNNKSEKEKFARENYFMKKPDEEIFIIVMDSSNVKK